MQSLFVSPSGQLRSRTSRSASVWVLYSELIHRAAHSRMWPINGFRGLHAVGTDRYTRDGALPASCVEAPALYLGRAPGGSDTVATLGVESPCSAVDFYAPRGPHISPHVFAYRSVRV
jgi:hypothetical protein